MNQMNYLNNDYVKTQPTPSDQLICSSGCYNSRITAKQHLKLMI